MFHRGILLTPRRELEKNVHSTAFLDEIHVLKQPFNKLCRKKKNTIKALLRGGGGGAYLILGIKKGEQIKEGRGAYFTS